MATFKDLIPGHYYLIQELENTSLELIFIPMATEKCILVEFQDEDQTLTWYQKKDEIFEIVEQLTEEQALMYENLFYSDEDNDEDFFWGNEEEEDDDFWEDDEEDDDSDEKIIAINN